MQKMYSITFIATVISILGNVESVKACDYSWDGDCASGMRCVGPICSLDGMIDGVCTEGGGGGGGGDFLPDDLGKAADLYLQAYLVPVKRGEGMADERLFRDAQNVRLGHRHEINHLELRQVIHEVLDAVLGFDFQHPRQYLSWIARRVPTSLQDIGNIHGGSEVDPIV